MNSLGPVDHAEIDALSFDLAAPLIRKFADMVASRGPRYATVALCATAERLLAVAVMPLSEESRRIALDVLVEAALESAENNDASFAAFAYERRTGGAEQ